MPSPDNHHIFTDATSFKYDVVLTKVDTKINKNERCAITMYESNGDAPHFYSVNVQTAGTNKPPTNNLTSTVGCNFHTAIRSFKQIFKEKTGVKWDDRVAFAKARTAREELIRTRAQRNGEDGSGSYDQDDNRNFKDMPFSYHPPMHGAKGLLPPDRKAVRAQQEGYPGPSNKRGHTGQQNNGSHVEPDTHLTQQPLQGPRYTDANSAINLDDAAEQTQTYPPTIPATHPYSQHPDNSLPATSTDPNIASSVQDEKQPWDSDDVDNDNDNNTSFTGIYTHNHLPYFQGSIDQAFGSREQTHIDLTAFTTPDVALPPFATDETIGHTQQAENAHIGLQDFMMGMGAGVDVNMTMAVGHSDCDVGGGVSASGDPIGESHGSLGAMDGQYHQAAAAASPGLFVDPNTNDEATGYDLLSHEQQQEATQATQDMHWSGLMSQLQDSQEA